MKIESKEYNGRLISVACGSDGIINHHVAPIKGMILTHGNGTIEVVHKGCFDVKRDGRNYNDRITRNSYGVSITLTEARKYYKELR